MNEINVRCVSWQEIFLIPCYSLERRRRLFLQCSSLCVTRKRLTKTKYFKSSQCLVPANRDKLPIAFCGEFATFEYLASLRPTLDDDKLAIFCYEHSSRNNGSRCTAPDIRCRTQTNFSVVIKTLFASVSRTLQHFSASCITDYEITLVNGLFLILNIQTKKYRWVLYLSSELFWMGKRYICTEVKF